MDTPSQEGLKKTATTAAEGVSKVGSDQKTKGGCIAAEDIKNIPRLQK